jgi:2-iminoacetate synthase ThiH
VRRDVLGDGVTYVVNRNINFTNICYTGRRVCVFAQRKGDADASDVCARVLVVSDFSRRVDWRLTIDR